MELHAGAARVVAVEAELAQHARGASRTRALAELAWHLRQRDSLRALQLADEGEASAAALASAAERDRCRLRHALTRCEVAALLCRIDEAEQQLALSQALQACDPAGPTDTLLAETLVARARGQPARADQAMAAALRMAEQGADAERAAVVQARLVCDKAAGVACALSDAQWLTMRRDHVAVDALLSVAEATQRLRREPARAVELFLHASEQGQRVGLVRDAVVAMINAGTTLRGLGEHEKAAACFDISESVARQTGWPGLLGSSRTQLGAFFCAHGRLHEAHELLVEAHRALAATPPGINRANACAELALVRLRLNRAVEAVEPMAEAIRMLRSAGAVDNLTLSLIDQATILSAADRLPEALAAIAEAQALIEAHGLEAVAVNLHQALAEIHRRHALPAPPGISEPNAALHHGELALAAGRRYAGWKPSAAELTALADDWAAAGDVGKAFGHARAAISALKDQMALLMRPSPSLAPLRSAGAPPPLDERGLWHPAFPPSPPSAAALFTPKELQVLRLLARGYTNKEIGISLEVSDQTVKWHLKQVFAKLEVSSRKQAAGRARALGVVAFEG